MRALSSPAAASALSRIISAESRNRGPRASHSFSGSSAIVLASAMLRCRYVRLITIVFIRLLDVPAAVDEVQREPIQQLGMRRRRALGAKVFGRFHESPAEERCQKRLTVTRAVSGWPRSVSQRAKARAVSRQAGGHRRQHGGRVGINLLAMLVVLAAKKHVGLLRPRQLPHDHDLPLPIGRRVGLPPGRLQCLQMLLPLGVDRRQDSIRKSARDRR